MVNDATLDETPSTRKTRADGPRDYPDAVGGNDESPFSEEGVNEFSLRDLMDFLIPFVERPADLCDRMPGFRAKGFGKILYAAMIRQTSAVDCGDAFRSEWAERKARLRGHPRATRGYHPHFLHGKKPALAEP